MQASKCVACRYAKDPMTEECVEKCPKGRIPVEGNECACKSEADKNCRDQAGLESKFRFISQVLHEASHAVQLFRSKLETIV